MCCSLLLFVAISPVVVHSQDQLESAGGRSPLPLFPSSSLPRTLAVVNRKRLYSIFRSVEHPLRATKRLCLTARQKADALVHPLNLIDNILFQRRVRPSWTWSAFHSNTFSPPLKLYSPLSRNIVNIFSLVPLQPRMTVHRHNFDALNRYSYFHELCALVSSSNALHISALFDVFVYRPFFIHLRRLTIDDSFRPMSLSGLTIRTGGLGKRFSKPYYAPTCYIGLLWAIQLFLVLGLEIESSLDGLIINIASFQYFLGKLAQRCLLWEFLLGLTIGYGPNFKLWILESVISFVNSPIKSIFELVGIPNDLLLYFGCWVLVVSVKLGGMDSRDISLAIWLVFFHLLLSSQSYAVTFSQTHTSTSLLDGYFQLRGSLDFMPLFWRVVIPGRFQFVRRYISSLESQRFNSHFEKISTTITRALNGLLRAALQWSYFGKYEIYVIKHLDPIEGFCILDDYHRLYMSTENLSFYLLYVIVPRLVFYFSVLWFEDATRIDMVKM